MSVHSYSCVGILFDHFEFIFMIQFFFFKWAELIIRNLRQATFCMDRSIFNERFPLIFFLSLHCEMILSYYNANAEQKYYQENCYLQFDNVNEQPSSVIKSLYFVERGCVFAAVLVLFVIAY